MSQNLVVLNAPKPSTRVTVYFELSRETVVDLLWSYLSRDDDVEATLAWLAGNPLAFRAVVEDEVRYRAFGAVFTEYSPPVPFCLKTNQESQIEGMIDDFLGVAKDA